MNEAKKSKIRNKLVIVILMKEKSNILSVEKYNFKVISYR